ncbi:MAG: hypothetical protein HY235_14320 [Acidobacteria bacterium]|nr:hypothetical protein [Acidobacteriota bacterium]
MLDPAEWEDMIAAVRKVRSLPFIDAQSVALMGGSHGAHSEEDGRRDGNATWLPIGLD